MPKVCCWANAGFNMQRCNLMYPQADWLPSCSCGVQPPWGCPVPLLTSPRASSLAQRSPCVVLSSSFPEPPTYSPHQSPFPCHAVRHNSHPLALSPKSDTEFGLEQGRGDHRTSDHSSCLLSFRAHWPPPHTHLYSLCIPVVLFLFNTDYRAVRQKKVTGWSISKCLSLPHLTHLPSHFKQKVSGSYSEL